MGMIRNIDFRSRPEVYMNDMELRKRDFLLHVGTPHEGSVPHSGRFPYGTGDQPYRHEDWFRGFGDNAEYYFNKYDGRFNECVNDLRKQGMTYGDIAKMLGISSDQVKARCTMSSNQYRDYMRVEVLHILNNEPKMTNQQVADLFGVTEGTIRGIKKANEAGLVKRAEVLELADQLKARVDEKGYVDVGEGNSYWISKSKSMLDSAAAIAAEEGYTLTNVRVKQPFGQNSTTVAVLAKPGTTAAEIQQNIEKVVPVFDPEINTEATLMGLDHPPVSIDSNRIAVKYAEEGGVLKDGEIGIRRGVADLNLGDAKYAQVRIAVDGTHYIKGVAYYDDTIPPGKDIQIYSNKHLGVPLTSSDPNAKQVLKPMKVDENGNIDSMNPFGAMIKAKVGQSEYVDPITGETKLSAINKVNEEGDWEKWSGKDYISSQMLSKQPITIAQRQLDLAVDKRAAEFDSIMQVKNPAIRKKLLEEYADACDGAAVDLEGAAFPRQQTHVLRSLPNMAENEVYAPNYKDGEHVILIRFPHQSVHEIPYLTVNNKNNPEGDKVIGRNARDAIGINPKTAAQLSGADYDGDTALVIPADNMNFSFKKPLESLVGFDNKAEYPYREGMTVMTKQSRGTQMGLVTNLITDMTAQGCNDTDQLVRAIKHSMVVIDAEKHKLDYQKSAVDNDIKSLYKEWQGKATGGAKTLIAKSSGKATVPDRKEGGYYIDKATGQKKYGFIDPETGEKIYTYTNKKTGGYYDKNGKYKPEKLAVQETTKMMKALTTGTHDARQISSGTPMEEVYADYANRCHQLGNKARKATLAIEIPTGVNPSAAKAYSKEVQSLSDKVAKAKKHSPLERQATMLAASMIRTYEKNNPNMRQIDPDKYKKVKSQYLAGARNRFGGGREKLVPTEKEWEAIDAGAVGKTLLNEVIRYTDSKNLKEHVMPSNRTPMTDAMKIRIKNYANGKYTNAEIAEALNLSTSTVSKVLAGQI